MINVKIWYLGMSYCKEHFNCSEFRWRSDKMISFIVGNTEHLVPFYNVDDVELTEV
jgi:hypothetical protein